MKPAILHHPDFQANIAVGHRFPMGKYGLIAQYLMEDGLAHPGGFVIPEPVEFDMAAHAHDPSYVAQVFQANVDTRISREIGFDINQSVSTRARLSSGATLLAGQLALDNGLATSTAGGSHHARRNQGAGFCVFNDVAIATANLLSQGMVNRVLIFDCDVHQGNGTAEIFFNDHRVKTVSIHGEKNYPTRKIASDLDIGLPDGTGDQPYLETLSSALEQSIREFQPDLVFYNAGVDPHHEDRLGRLSLSNDGLEQRDRTVIRFFRERGIALAGVQGGGYSNDIEAVARRHTIIHHVAAEFA